MSNQTGPKKTVSDFFILDALCVCGSFVFRSVWYYFWLDFGMCMFYVSMFDFVLFILFCICSAIVRIWIAHFMIHSYSLLDYVCLCVINLIFFFFCVGPFE